MGIAEAGRPFRFFQETAPVGGIGAEVGSEAFERNQPFELGVFRAIHLAHTAFAQQILDAEASYSDAGQGLGCVRPNFLLVMGTPPLESREPAGRVRCQTHPTAGHLNSLAG
jgi:hypothetical protein